MKEAGDVHQVLLRRCNDWIAENWKPSWSYPKAWDDAILNIVGGPVPKEGRLLQEVSSDQFTEDQGRVLTDTYFELMKLAADYDLSEEKLRLEQDVARMAFGMLNTVMDLPSEGRPDLIPVPEGSGRRAAAIRWTKRHDRQDSFSEMYDVVVTWLINAPGGLFETTDSLIELAGLDDNEDD